MPQLIEGARYIVRNPQRYTRSVPLILSDDDTVTLEDPDIDLDGEVAVLTTDGRLTYLLPEGLIPLEERPVEGDAPCTCLPAVEDLPIAYALEVVEYVVRRSSELSRLVR